MEILNFNQTDTIYICMKAYILTRMTNSSEFFYKYFKILPKNFNDFPYFFSKTELNLLKNTFFYEDIKLNFKAATDALWMNNDLCCYKTDDVFNILKAS